MANFNNRLTMDFAFLLVSYNGILLNFLKLKIHLAKVGTREAEGVIPTGTVMLIIPYSGWRKNAWKSFDQTWTGARCCDTKLQ